MLLALNGYPEVRLLGLIGSKTLRYLRLRAMSHMRIRTCRLSTFSSSAVQASAPQIHSSGSSSFLPGPAP